jgi:hypothetical protein
MKTYGGVDVYIHIFLTLALVGGKWSASCPGRFTSVERAYGTHWIGGWMDPRAGLDDMEKRKFLTLPGLELRLLSRPARSQSLYRLSYPGSVKYILYFIRHYTDLWKMQALYLVSWKNEEEIGLSCCSEIWHNKLADTKHCHHGSVAKSWTSLCVSSKF